MSLFIFIIIIITFFVCIFFYRFLNLSFKNISREEINSKLFQQQFNEIKLDLDRGLINGDEYNFMENELSRRVLTYSSNRKEEILDKNKGILKYVKFFIIISIILITFLSYMINGNPKLPDLPFYSRLNDEVPKIFYEEALVDIDKKIAKDKNNIELFILKANTYSLLNRGDESLALWKYIIDVFPEEVSGDIYLSYGESLMQETFLKQNKIIISVEVFNIFEKAIKNSEISSEVWAIAFFYRGLYFYQQEKLFEAKKVWKFLLDNTPDDVIWRKNLSIQIDQLLNNENISDNNDEVLNMVQRLEDRLYSSNSENIYDWQKLGRSFLVLGEIKKSIKAYNRAFLLDEENIDSMKGLAEAKLLNRDPGIRINEEVLDLFNKIILKEPNNQLALWVLAEEEIRIGNLKRARILLNNLLLHLSSDSEEYKLVTDQLNKINR
tara:strand:+ start:26629 stop:27942 length:1314 start_codon:yes stop_codon:yes gene_type:complete